MGIIDFFGGLFIGVVLMLFILLMFILIGIGQRKFPTSKRFKKILWSISSIFVLLTPFIIPIKVIEKSQFEMLTFGFPLGFVQQYTNHEIVSREFPFMTTLINPWGHSITSNLNIRVDLFITSLAIVYVLLYLIAYATKRLRLVKGNG